MKSGIYQIENRVNGKRYIGSAVNLRHRRERHLCDLRHGRHHNRHLQRAYDKYGEAALEFSILEDIEDVPQLVPREQHYLDTLNPEYNMAPMAGSLLGCQLSLETRRKMSEAHKGQRPSAETLAKLRAAWTPERRRKNGELVSERNKSHPPSLETRAKISLALRGDRSPSYGKHPSAETLAKISGARHHNYGKHPSEATRAKMRAAWTPERREAQSKRSAAMHKERRR